jgi:hypothetical protein
VLRQRYNQRHMESGSGEAHLFPATPEAISVRASTAASINGRIWTVWKGWINRWEQQASRSVLGCLVVAQKLMSACRPAKQGAGPPCPETPFPTPGAPQKRVLAASAPGCPQCGW